jgi:hypothetical protein
VVNRLVDQYKAILASVPTPTTNTTVTNITNTTDNTTGSNTTATTNTTNTTNVNTPITYGPNPSGPYTAPPAISLTANGSKDITVNVGDPITYTWFTDASKAESSVIMDYGKADSCPGGRLATLYYPWEVFTTSGTYTKNVLPCQAGTTYTINFIGLYGTNNTYRSSSQVVVRVKPQTTASSVATMSESQDFEVSSFPSSFSTNYINKTLSSSPANSLAFIITLTPKNGFEGLVNLSIPSGIQGLTGGFVTGNSSSPYSLSKQVALSGNQPQTATLLFSATPLAQLQKLKLELTLTP